MSRRSGTSSKSNARRDALARMKESRAGGISEVDRIQVSETSLFDEMNEQDYEDMVRKRREETPFVENDDVELGYYDDGEEKYFDETPDIGEDEFNNDEHTEPGKGKGALSSAYAKRMKKKQRAKLGDKGASSEKVINSFFATKGKEAGSAAARSLGKKAKQDIDLDSMLNDLESNPGTSHTGLAPRRTFSSSRYTNDNYAPSSLTTSITLPSQDNDDMGGMLAEYDDIQDTGMMAAEEEPMAYREDVDEFPAEEKVDHSNNAMEVEETHVEETHVKEEKVEEKKLSVREMLFQKAKTKENRVSEATKVALAAPEVEEIVPEIKIQPGTLPKNEVAEWWNNQTSTEGAEESATLQSISQNAEPETIDMYWLDAVELRDRPGKLYLTGKVCT